MMKLTDTVDGMNSTDYKERFKAEYYQLKIRLCGLMNMLDKWDKGKLSFNPTCPRKIYDDQIDGMVMYLGVLESRAEIENIDLDLTVGGDLN